MVCTTEFAWETVTGDKANITAATSIPSLKAFLL